MVPNNPKNTPHVIKSWKLKCSKICKFQKIIVANSPPKTKYLDRTIVGNSKPTLLVVAMVVVKLIAAKIPKTMPSQCNLPETSKIFTAINVPMMMVIAPIILFLVINFGLVIASYIKPNHMDCINKVTATETGIYWIDK